jgi:hypothetical protein
MTLFLVLDDNEMKWISIAASSVEDAVRIARNNKWEPYYVVDEKLATRVWEEEKLKKSMDQEKV